MEEMKKLELKSQIHGKFIKKSIDLFNSLLEESEFNLDQFVNGDALAISNEISDQFVKNLKEFINIIPDAVREIEDQDVFWNTFSHLKDYENNKKFIIWIRRYLETTMRPKKEAAFINEINQDVFENMCQYCFENLILQNIGEKRIDTNIGDIKQLIILRKIIYTFIDMVVVENFSKENAFENMEKIFGIERRYCEYFWKLFQQNEEKIWRFMMMKQYSRINNKLNHIIDILEE